MKSDPQPNTHGQSLTPIGGGLISDFQAAQLTLMTMQSSAQQAEQTEIETLHQFAAFKQPDEAYVTPSSIPITQHDSLTHASLDAHLQKVQAQQIEQFGERRLDELQAAAQKQYLGRKVRIRVLDKKLRPIHSCWQDQQSGGYYYGANQLRSITGTVHKLSLLDNYLIIKPTLGRRLLTRGSDYYLVDVLDPLSALPVIGLSQLR